MRTAGFVYDNNGNLAKKCESGTVTLTATTCSGNTVSDLTHDSLNRLTQVIKTGISTESYKYDDQGNRIQKTVGSAITNFLYNGPDIIGQYTSTWATSAILTHGPGMDDPIMRVAGATAQYYHQDGLGSVVSVTNQTGAIDSTARYDAWGSKIGSTGTIPQFGYTGREPDETGLIYYRARFYDPSIGRFIQRDPIGMNGGINLYAYVKGNPINFNDPRGLVPRNPDDPMQLAAASGNYAGTGTGMTAGQQTLQVQGYPETGAFSWRAQHDQIFIDMASDWNFNHDLSPGDDGFRTPEFLKTWAMVESGGSKQAFLSDPFQVNNLGDWVPEKQSLLGLQSGQVMIPVTSTEAALQWLHYKSYTYDAAGNKTFLGDWMGLYKYNGSLVTHSDPNRLNYGSDYHPGIPHKEWYASQILLLEYNLRNRP